MGYSEFIEKIISDRGRWSIPEGVFYEVHHIVPRCMGGEPEIHKRDMKHPNLIWLYPREHFIAHVLLSIEHPDHYGLFTAIKQTSKNFELTPEEYQIIRQEFSNLPERFINLIRDNGVFRYKVKKERVRKNPDLDTSNYSKEMRRRYVEGIFDLSGSKNPMYGKGYKISGGKNGHASVRYFFKGITFECRNDLYDYLAECGYTITKSAIRRLIHGTGSMRLYKMYQDVFDYLSWEFK